MVGNKSNKTIDFVAIMTEKEAKIADEQGNKRRLC